MKNISSMPNGIFIPFLLFVLVFASNAQTRAGVGEKKAPIRVLDAVVKEDSKPVVGPEVFKVEPPKPDPFFDKLRRERQKFFRKQREKRLTFLEKVRNKDWDTEKLQKVLAEFHEKDIESVQKFVRKQREKIEEHMEKKGLG